MGQKAEISWKNLDQGKNTIHEGGKFKRNELEVHKANLLLKPPLLSYFK